MSEMSNSLSIINIPRRLSRDFMGFLPPTIEPEFVGTLVDNRLEGAYAVGVNGMNAYVASRWCKTCVVLVSLAMWITVKNLRVMSFVCCTVYVITKSNLRPMLFSNYLSFQ